MQFPIYFLYVTFDELSILNRLNRKKNIIINFEIKSIDPLLYYSKLYGIKTKRNQTFYAKKKINVSPKIDLNYLVINSRSLSVKF